MAKALERILPTGTAKQVLVIAQDPWLRFQLQRELERADCAVVALARLRPDELAGSAGYDIVLTDAALLPEGSRLEALRALRAGSPQARFVLLVGPGEQAMRERAIRSGFDQVLERPRRAEAWPRLIEELFGSGRPQVAAVPVPLKFQFLLEAPEGTGRRRAGTAFTGLFLNVLLLLVAITIPLIFTESLPLQELAQTWLVAPPPPPPPPPPAPQSALQARRVKPVLLTPTGKLVAPSTIPREIAKIVEPTDVELDVGGVAGGVPGGVPGGQLGGVLGGVLGGIPTVPRNLQVPRPSLQAPLRVGGNIRPPRLIRRVEPSYPTIARQARIQGDVRIDAIIDTSGHVVEMKVLSGHPLLVQEAMRAVQQWVYQPTLLNNEPVPVVLEVTVHFRMM